MKMNRGFIVIATCCCALWSPLNSRAERIDPEKIGVGQKFETLKTIEGEEFHDVEIVSRENDTLKFTHRDGISQILIKDLPNDGLPPNKEALNYGIIGRKFHELAISAKNGAAVTVTTLKDVSVVRIEPDGLTIQGDSGLTKVNYKELPADLQKECNFIPSIAEDYAAHSALQQAATLERSGELKQPADTEAQPKSAPAAVVGSPLNKAGVSNHSRGLNGYQNPLERGAHDRGTPLQDRIIDARPLNPNGGNISSTWPSTSSNDNNHSTVINGYGATSEAAELDANNQAHKLADGTNGRIPNIKKTIRSQLNGTYRCTYFMEY